MRTIIPVLAAVTLLSGSLFGQKRMSTDELIDSILAVGARQFEAVDDMTMDAIHYDSDINKKGEAKETKEFRKKIFLKKSDSTYKLQQEYYQYYLDGKLQSEEKLNKEIKAIEKEGRKRRRGGLASDILKPMRSAYREMYDFVFDPDSAATVSDIECFILYADLIEPDDSNLNYTYYISREHYQPVRVDLTVPKMAAGLFFKMKKFEMSIYYRPITDDIWGPDRFEFEFQARAALFIGIHKNIREIYSNHTLNSGFENIYHEYKE